jgi:hypothetical protein
MDAKSGRKTLLAINEYLTYVLDVFEDFFAFPGFRKYGLSHQYEVLPFWFYLSLKFNEKAHQNT